MIPNVGSIDSIRQALPMGNGAMDEASDLGGVTGSSYVMSALGERRSCGRRFLPGIRLQQPEPISQDADKTQSAESCCDCRLPYGP